MEPEFQEFFKALSAIPSDSANTGELVAHAEKLGLQARPVELSLAEALIYTGPATPLLTRLTQPEPGWLVLEGGRGRRIGLTHVSRHGAIAKRQTQKELENLLRTDAKTPISWLVVNTLSPLQAAVSPADGELKPLERLPRLFQPDRREIILSMIFALGVGLLSLATPVAVQALVNTFALGGLLQPLILLSIALFTFLSFGGALRVLQTYVVEIIQRRIFVRVLADLAYRLPRLRSEVLDQSHGTELVNRFFDVLTVQKVSAILLLDGVAILLQTLIGLLVLAFYHPWLLAFDILMLLAILFIVFVLGRDAEESAIAESKYKYAAAAWLEELARNPLSFKHSGGSELALARADQRAWDYLSARGRHFRVVLSQTIGSIALQAIAGTALLALGGDLVIKGQLTLGQLVAAELIVSTVLASFSKFSKQLENFYDLLAAVDKLGHVIDLPLEVNTGSREKYPVKPASLNVRGLHFGYPHRPDLFNDFSLQLESGQRVALVGVNGSGKSTLAELLFGLRDFERGRIELNGIEIRDLHRDSLRRYLVVVRDAEIIEDTIMENVRMGRSEVSTQQIRQVLADLGLSEEMLKLPEGLNTVLTHAGLPLSLGQLRRLMLARAVVGQPTLLVVDELLDDLEPGVQTRVCDYLFAPTAPWTLLVLSLHDSGYVQRCDRIVKLPTR